MNSGSVAAGGTVYPSDVVFGNLIELAMASTGVGSVEICEGCSTINLGSARFCKSCSHKLSAFHAARTARETVLPPKRRLASPERSWAWDLAAFCVVINALAGVTALVPLG
ncbi:hypothetical protein J7E62_31575 [Variovorax paradoxus]|nr:hypothetical protein [Variovorax paradoxus]